MTSKYIKKTIFTLVLTALFLFANRITVQSQIFNYTDKPSKGKYYLEANLHSGMIINNYVYWDSFPSRNPSALLELQFGKQSIGEKPWQQHFGFPQMGVSLITGYLGNNDELGQTIGIVPNLTLNAKNEKKWSLKMKLGLGFAYFNKPYNDVDNRTNILIGSHITNMSIAQLYYRRMLNEHMDFNFGVSAIHASNGHYQLPNVGANMVNINAGIKYYFDKRPKSYYVDTAHIVKSKKIRYGLRFGYGMHEFGNERGPVNQGKYPITDIAFYLKKPVGKLGNAQVGLAYKFYESSRVKIIEDSTFSSHINLKSSVFTLFLAYEFEMGQMSFLAQGGVNVYNPFWKRFTELIRDDWTFYKQLEGLISTRLGLQYYFFDTQKFKNNIYLGIYIKANMGGADFASLNVGFVF